MNVRCASGWRNVASACCSVTASIWQPCKRGLGVSPVRSGPEHPAGRNIDVVCRMARSQVVRTVLFKSPGAFWWAWPLFALAQLPGMMEVLRTVYRQIAATRSCKGNACELTPQSHPGDWTFLILLPVMVLATRTIIPAWVFMWLLAGSLYFGCKWLTWRRGLRQVEVANQFISLGYLFGWVGMDAKRFLRPAHIDLKPEKQTWWLAIGRILVGVTLIWAAVPCLIANRPIAAGWTGMLGVVPHRTCTSDCFN